MPNSTQEDTKVADIVNAVAALTQKIPIYQDAIQPAAQQLGEALETISKSFNLLLLLPLKLTNSFIEEKLPEKLKKIPPDRIQLPDPSIAIPVLQGININYNHEILRELFLELLTTAMDKNKSSIAHPCLAEIIKQISPDEAKIIKHLSLFDDYPNICNIIIQEREGYGAHTSSLDQLHKLIISTFKKSCNDLELENKNNIELYYENLTRLKIIKISSSGTKKETISTHTKYEQGKPVFTSIKNYNHRYLCIFSKLGECFVDACVLKNVSN
ncbi:hypothetical protein KKHLCK_13885 [Candidatus Electrothrix laxa]